MMMRDPFGSRSLLGCSTKQLDFVSTSSSEAEVVGAVVGMQRVGLPMQVIREELYDDRQDNVHLEILIDNATAEQVVRTGETKQMRYLRKTQRINECWAREQMVGHGRTDRTTRVINTGDNVSDISTKLPSLG